eukprot:9787685-Ditylum_brightwellii.AAC.1
MMFGIIYYGCGSGVIGGGGHFGGGGGSVGCDGISEGHVGSFGMFRTMGGGGGGSEEFLFGVFMKAIGIFERG